MTDISARVTDIVIRMAGDGEQDTRAVARLRQEWVAERHSQRGVGPAPLGADFEPQLADWYLTESGRCLTWLAELGGRPVGMVNLVVFTRAPYGGTPASRWGYLTNAFVLATHRNRGIGGRLLNGLLDHARENDLTRVVLSPSERSVPFYQRAGFGPADMLLAKVLTG